MEMYETIIVLGLPLNAAHIILGQILSMVFNDFKLQELKSIPTPPIVTMSFTHAYAETNLHPWLDSWHFSSSFLL